MFLFLALFILVGLPHHSRSFSQRVLSRKHHSSSSIAQTIMMAGGTFEWKQVRKNAEEKMVKSIESIQSQFNTLRASGANPAILDRVMVDVYGAITPLTQIARIASAGSQQIVVEPFDKSALKNIEKAIATSDLNLTPNSDGSLIRINIPPLTEERRKQAKGICEDGKVALRNVRRDVVDKIKAAEKDKLISKDDSKGFQDDLQKVTDDSVKKLDTMLKTKEKDLMKV
eukprot:gene14191-19042_t